MATLYRVNGAIEELKPANGINYKLAELQAAVGGYVEILDLLDEKIMAVNEDGLALGLPVNPAATALASGVLDPGNLILGDALVCEAGEVR